MGIEVQSVNLPFLQIQIQLGSIVEQLFTQSPAWLLYIATFFYFLLLYFGFAFTGEYISKKFSMKNIGSKIGEKNLDNKQVKREITNSLVSITVFGFFGVIPQLAYKWGWVNIQWFIDWKLFPLEMAVIFVWNDLHFYCCHWLLHRRWLFKRVHYIHHRSLHPTSFSTYSFHWVEAFLLSTVMIIPMFFYDFCYLTLLLLPVMSIFLNTLGHWSYDLFPGDNRNKLLKCSVLHGIHHKKVHGNYGFFLHYFDSWFGTEIKSLNISGKK